MKIEDIDKGANVIVKWGKALVDANGDVTEGVMHAPAEEFITRIEKESKLLPMLRYIEMQGEKADLQHLRVSPRLQNMQKVSNNNKLSTDILGDLLETIPDILKDELQAVPLTAYTLIPKIFLKTNIEHENFLTKYEGILAPECAFSAESIAVFGKPLQSGETAGSGGVPQAQDGMLAMEGLLYQLDAVRTSATTGGTVDTTKPHGKSVNTIYQDNPIAGVQALIEEYIGQGGKRSEAKVFVDSITEFALIREAGKRETQKGDLYYFDNGVLYINGVEIVQLDVLDKPERGYGSVAIIMNPASVAYAPVLEAESEAEYSVARKAYLTSIDFMFDIGIVFATDVLYSDVQKTSPSSGD